MSAFICGVACALCWGSIEAGEKKLAAVFAVAAVYFGIAWLGAA